jgi:hypothetical protein
MYIVQIERPPGSTPVEVKSNHAEIHRAVAEALSEAFGGHTTVHFRDTPKHFDTNYFGVVTRLEGAEMRTDEFYTQVRISLCHETKKRLALLLSQVEQDVAGDTLSDTTRALLTAFLLRSTP